MQRASTAQTRTGWCARLRAPKWRRRPVTRRWMRKMRRMPRLLIRFWTARAAVIRKASRCAAGEGIEFNGRVRRAPQVERQCNNQLLLNSQRFCCLRRVRASFSPYLAARSSFFVCRASHSTSSALSRLKGAQRFWRPCVFSLFYRAAKYISISISGADSLKGHKSPCQTRARASSEIGSPPSCWRAFTPCRLHTHTHDTKIKRNTATQC